MLFILRLLCCSSVFLQVAGVDPRQKEMGKPLKVAESDVDVSDYWTVTVRSCFCVCERVATVS